MAKYVVSLMVHVTVEANSPYGAQEAAWAQRAALLSTARPQDITAAQVVRLKEPAS